jgi:hypothetical protein
MLRAFEEDASKAFIGQDDLEIPRDSASKLGGGRAAKTGWEAGGTKKVGDVEVKFAVRLLYEVLIVHGVEILDPSACGSAIYHTQGHLSVSATWVLPV